jgi:DNA-binding CsgD family transcriptional regulator
LPAHGSFVKYATELTARGTDRYFPFFAIIIKLYDLSPAELRVAAALLSGKSPEHYALEAGVTMNTVRTQLKSLFQKTGTGRQAELVAVLGRVPSLQS